MDSTIHEPLNLGAEELAFLSHLLESERNRLLIEIRHAHHRAYRDELHARLDLVERLVERCGSN